MDAIIRQVMDNIAFPAAFMFSVGSSMEVSVRAVGGAAMVGGRVVSRYIDGILTCTVQTASSVHSPMQHKSEPPSAQLPPISMQYRASNGSVRIFSIVVRSRSRKPSDHDSNNNGGLSSAFKFIFCSFHPHTSSGIVMGSSSMRIMVPGMLLVMAA